MSAISLRIPNSIHIKVREIVKKDHISINQFVNSALAEKISVFMSEEYLTERAEKGSRAKFEKALSKVKKNIPEEQDRI